MSLPMIGEHFESNSGALKSTPDFVAGAGRMEAL